VSQEFVRDGFAQRLDGGFFEAISNISRIDYRLNPSGGRSIAPVRYCAPVSYSDIVVDS
jgi:hypothetical protein